MSGHHGPGNYNGLLGMGAILFAAIPGAAGLIALVLLWMLGG